LIAVTILNRALRPLLSRRHPELFHYESQLPGVSLVELPADVAGVPSPIE